MRGLWAKRLLTISVVLLLWCNLAYAEGGDNPADGSGLNQTPLEGVRLTLRVLGKDVGDTIVVRGEGYMPGEPVALQVALTDAVGGRGTAYAQWQTSAGASGQFETAWVVSDQYVAGKPLVFTATGQQSGHQASAYSVEVDSRLTILSSPESVTIGQPFTVSVLLEQNCCDGNFAPMPGRTVWFQAHAGECGVDPLLPPLATAVTDQAGVATATMVLNEAGHLTLGVKYDGEPEPQEGPNSACDPEASVTILASIDCTYLHVLFPPPQISCPSGRLAACQGESYWYQVTVVDAGAGRLTFSVAPGLPASINPLTGLLCLVPDTSGTYEIEVTATDSTGQSGTCTAVFTVGMNLPPVVNAGPDTTVHLCQPSQICLPVSVSDPDNAVVAVTATQGAYANGHLCFTPYAAGRYEITVTAVDECGLAGSDMVVVDVTTDENVAIVCPPDTEVFACGVDTFCFPIGGIPQREDVSVEVMGINAWWDEQTQQVCFFSACSFSNNIAVRVNTDCGSYTCGFAVTVNCNTAPLLILPPDSTIGGCDAGTVCIPVGVADPDGNLADVNVEGATYDPLTGLACFEAAGEGTHKITVTAVDDCGLSVQRTFTATLAANRPPEVSCPGDQTVSVCEFSHEICVSGFAASDPDNNLVSLTVNGTAVDNGTYCFVPREGANVLQVIAGDACGLADTCYAMVNVVPNQPPSCGGPDDTTIVLCRPERVCLPLWVNDPDGNFSRWEVTYGGGQVVDGMWCFDAVVPRVEHVTVRAYDGCWAYCEHSFTVTFEVNQLPVATDRYSAVSLCTPGDLREIYPLIYDPDGDRLTYSLISGDATIDPATGRVSYRPLADGVYTFEVAAYDTCGGDTGLIVDTVSINEPPSLISYDSTVRLCDLKLVCFEVIGLDPDGDSLDIYQMSGPGEFTQLTDTSGQSCFMPANVDSATYVFTYCVADPCVYHKAGVQPPSCPPCNPDTIRITVVLDRPPLLQCPGPQTFTTCEPGTFCFQVSGQDPEGGSLVYHVLSGNAEISGSDVCVYGSESASFQVVIEAVDLCGHADTCTVPVTINGNRAPEVTLADDFTASLCGPGQVCFAAQVEDYDGDQLVINPSFGTYNAERHEVCFRADTAGVYVITVTASDECQTTAEDTIEVTVRFGQPPTVNLGQDRQVALCEPGEVCTDVVLGGSFSSVTTNLGSYNDNTHQVCFTATEAGNYTLVVTAEGECGRAADTAVIAVLLNKPPTISPLNDSTVQLCSPTKICWPVSIVDPEGQIASVVVSNGATYENGYICFTPYTSGTFEISVTATDQCGATAVESALLTVHTDQEVQIAWPKDTTVFACGLDTFCIPIGGVPAGARVATRGINTWYDQQSQSICFFAACGMRNQVSVDIITACGQYHGRFTADVRCNVPPIVILPPDTSIANCQWQDICIPVAVSDPNGNLMSVWTGGYPYLEYDPVRHLVCFWGDRTGDYHIIVYAVDSCGLMASDTMTVHLWTNTPPMISYCHDTLLTVCQPDVCVRVDVLDGDGDETITDVLTDFGYYDWDRREFCFTADTSGHYCSRMIAIDSCGAADTAMICVNVAIENQVAIDCPDGVIEVQPLCGPDTVCVPLPIAGQNFDVDVDYGVWHNGVLCFWADTTAIFAINVRAVGPCNSDSCEVLVSIKIADTNLIVCPGNKDTLLCDADTLCFDYTVSPQVTGVSVTPPAFLHQGQVCVPVLQQGVIDVTMTAQSVCGPDHCSFRVTSTFNTPPVVTLGNDTTIEVCGLVPECFPFHISDAEHNVVSVTASSGATIVDSTVCFTPPNLGTFSIMVTATDACGKWDRDTIRVTFTSGGTPWISCPQAPQVFTLCEPDSVCVSGILIQPSNAQVEVLPAGTWHPDRQQVCIWVDHSAVYNVKVRVTAACGKDSCMFSINATVGETPTVTCPSRIDTLMCFNGTETLCYPVAISGPAAQITVWPIGSYGNGQVCVPISGAGTYNVNIAAATLCGADTCQTTIHVTADQLPQLTVPEGTLTFERCPDDTDVICIDGIFASDAEGIESLVQTCGPGTFHLATADSGALCLPKDIAMGLYEACFVATDDCHIVEKSFHINIVEKPDCEVCLKIRIDGGDCIPVGVIKTVNLVMETDMYLGGYDLLMSFDASVLAFISATDVGTEIEGWEYFNSRLNSANCSPNCPAGLIRLVAIAEINNGPHHPPHESLNPNGVVARMRFQVANDQNLGDQFLPIRFVTYDCGDNGFSDTTGNDLYVDLRIFGPEDYLLWDETDNVHFPEASRPFGMGTADSCIIEEPGKNSPIRCVEFYNGGICILHPDSIDIRGDVNLNGIPYEIADAVVFSNYFIYGLSVFTVNVAGQIAATDVNSDGATLTVADLVLLIRIIIGDTEPVPKLAPYADMLNITTERTNDGLTVSTDAVSDIGAALLVFDIEGDVAVDEVRLAQAAQQMDVQWGVDHGQLRVLVYDIGRGRIEPGSHDLVHIPVSGSGTLSLAQAEIVDYQGRPYRTAGKRTGTPSDYALYQNYPNPFNPTTTIEFALPGASDWTLTIYNINGALVSQFSGSANAGTQQVVWEGTNLDGSPVASGVYFYRLDTNGFTDTKKMLLLK